jgi:hypothetical protein
MGGDGKVWTKYGSMEDITDEVWVNSVQHNMRDGQTIMASIAEDTSAAMTWKTG